MPLFFLFDIYSRFAVGKFEREKSVSLLKTVNLNRAINDPKGKDLKRRFRDERAAF